jgi:hypothetical protein
MPMATARAASKLHIPRDITRARLQDAVDTFLSQPRFSAQTQTSYGNARRSPP